VEAIRTAGLANQKGPRIQNALRIITEQQGELSLDFLADMEIEEARKWLTSIKGVGPKTAAIVLCFALGKPAFPVDTHVHRVTRRLGLISPKTPREQAHTLLEELLPMEIYYPFHMNLIPHGRQVCKSQQPRCSSPSVCLLSLSAPAPAKPTDAARERKPSCRNRRSRLGCRTRNDKFSASDEKTACPIGLSLRTAGFSPRNFPPMSNDQPPQIDRAGSSQTDAAACRSKLSHDKN
jgi:hypothetical protein